MQAEITNNFTLKINNAKNKLTESCVNNRILNNHTDTSRGVQYNKKTNHQKQIMRHSLRAILPKSI